MVHQWADQWGPAWTLPEQRSQETNWDRTGRQKEARVTLAQGNPALGYRVTMAPVGAVNAS